MMNWIAALQAMGASKPRRQQLFCAKASLPPDIFAIVRLTWYRRGKPYSTEEFSVEHEEGESKEALMMLAKEALKSGADVSILAACSPEELGIE